MKIGLFWQDCYGFNLSQIAFAHMVYVQIILHKVKALFFLISFAVFLLQSVVAF